MEKKASLPRLMANGSVLNSGGVVPGNQSSTIILTDPNSNIHSLSQAQPVVLDQHQSQIEALKDLQHESRIVELREQREAERLEQLMLKVQQKKQIMGKGNPISAAPVKDEKDVKLDKLKQVNFKLRQRLKELNAQLEKTIEKANTRKVQKQLQQQQLDTSAIGGQSLANNIEHQIKLKEKELKNAQTQVELYRRELSALQSKVDDLSGVDRLLQLETRLREGQQEKSELERKVRELEKQGKEQGKMLEKMSNEEEFQAKMKCLVDELRIWKEKVRRLEIQQEKEENTRKAQSEKIQQFQEENRKYQSVLEQLKLKKGLPEQPSDTIGPAELARREEELSRLEQEKRNLESQVTEEEKRQKAEVRKWERKVKQSEEKLDVLQKELKEKEQENRINKLKIKEMRRLIKHNQLKPIGGGSNLPMLPSSTVDMEENKNHAQETRRTIEKLGNTNDNTFLTGGGLEEDEINIQSAEKTNDHQDPISIQVNKEVIAGNNDEEYADEKFDDSQNIQSAKKQQAVESTRQEQKQAQI